MGHDSEYCDKCERWHPPIQIEHESWFTPCRKKPCDCAEHVWIEWNGFQESIIAIHDKQVNGCSGPFKMVRHK